MTNAFAMGIAEGLGETPHRAAAASLTYSLRLDVLNKRASMRVDRFCLGAMARLACSCWTAGTEVSSPVNGLHGGGLADSTHLEGSSGNIECNCDSAGRLHREQEL